MAIERTYVGNSRLWALGLDAIDYAYDGEQIHIQDLATKLSVARAQRVRDEMNPLSEMMRARNRQSEKYGFLLAKINKMQANFDPEAQGNTQADEPLTAEDADLLQKIGYDAKADEKPSKALVQEYLQAVKAKIDSLNNRSQLDMNRAQSLMETSDGSYETASNLLTALVESRGTTISAIGS